MLTAKLSADSRLSREAIALDDFPAPELDPRVATGYQAQKG